ncbi:metal-dependent hydrolase [Halorussus salinisoli]|uniref:metal-dependent hydrolase n=1 Tax=Halorussus salinisoli TaxID=2558242 RepID=UPI0010C1D9D7|nr:metal-dependent hydrolase [Halorussus salinisoli]
MRNHHFLQVYPIIALAVGTQFPDLIDKPLAWTFGILPNSRSLTHSVLTAIIVITALRFLIQHRHHLRHVTAFSIRYLSHLGADALHPFITGEYYYSPSSPGQLSHQLNIPPERASSHISKESRLRRSSPSNSLLLYLQSASGSRTACRDSPP